MTPSFSSLSSHRPSSNQEEDAEAVIVSKDYDCPVTPQPLQPSANAETPDCKTTSETRRRRLDFQSLHDAHAIEDTLQFHRQSSSPSERLDDAQPPMDPSSSTPRPHAPPLYDPPPSLSSPWTSLNDSLLLYQRSYSEEVLVQQPHSMSNSTLDLESPLETTSAPVLARGCSTETENKLEKIHAIQLFPQPPDTREPPFQQLVIPESRACSYTEVSHAGQRCQTSASSALGFSMETDDEFSLLLAAAASAYLNTLNDSMRHPYTATALRGLPGAPLTQDSASSVGTLEDKTLLRFASGKLEPYSALMQDDHHHHHLRITTTTSSDYPVDMNDESNKFTPQRHQHQQQLSSCHSDTTPTTAGLSSTVSTDHNHNNHNGLHFSTPLPPSYSSPANHSWDSASTTTHRFCAYGSPSDVGAMHRTRKSQPDVADVGSQKRGTGEETLDNRDSVTLHDPAAWNGKHSSPHHDVFGMCLSSAANNALVPNSRTSKPSLNDYSSVTATSSLYPSLSKPPTPQQPDGPATTRSEEYASPQETLSPFTVHPSSFLLSKGVGGRHFSPPIVLAHPEEFRNPSSFLKVYGDPLCGVDGKNSNANSISDSYNTAAAVIVKNAAHLTMNGLNGNWVCLECQNVNYPRRFRCNKCNAMRDTFGDQVVSEYALRVYHHHLKSYKKLGRSGTSSTVTPPLRSTSSISVAHHSHLGHSALPSTHTVTPSFTTSLLQSNSHLHPYPPPYHEPQHALVPRNAVASSACSYETQHQLYRHAEKISFGMDSPSIMPSSLHPHHYPHRRGSFPPHRPSASHINLHSSRRDFDNDDLALLAQPQQQQSLLGCEDSSTSSQSVLSSIHSQAGIQDQETGTALSRSNGRNNEQNAKRNAKRNDERGASHRVGNKKGSMDEASDEMDGLDPMIYCSNPPKGLDSDTNLYQSPHASLLLDYGSTSNVAGAFAGIFNFLNRDAEFETPIKLGSKSHDDLQAQDKRSRVAVASDPSAVEVKHQTAAQAVKPFRVDNGHDYESRSIEEKHCVRSYHHNSNNNLHPQINHSQYSGTTAGTSSVDCWRIMNNSAHHYQHQDRMTNGVINTHDMNPDTKILTTDFSSSFTTDRRAKHGRLKFPTFEQLDHGSHSIDIATPRSRSNYHSHFLNMQECLQ